ncbi:MAG: portal protein [Bdellovibrionales bacterium]|jgi:hypothetical protein
MSKEEKLRQIHTEAIKAFDIIQKVQRDERMQCLQDRRFATIPGAQWEGTLGEQFENKPKIEVNKANLAVKRIFSEYRNNKISAMFTSKEGDEYDDLADTCAGLFRADEQDSQGDEAYDNCFEEGCMGGFGAFRLRSDYEDDEDDENEKQRILFEPIYDADTSVFFDLNAKRYDKSDGVYAFVMIAKTPEAYEEEFGEFPSSLYKTIHQRYFDWFSPEVVYVAEYYKFEEKTETIHIFEGMMGESEKYKHSDLTEEKLIELNDRGFKEVRTRKIKRKKVHKYIIDGARVIEDCGIIAGKYIPIIPFYGQRWFIDNVERCAGAIRYVKDAQRLKNMQISKLAEISSKTSYEKPIFTPEQVAGHEQRWSEDDVKNYPYLLINPVMDSNGNSVNQGATDYVRPPNVPATLAALIQLSDTDMNDILGNQQAGEQVVSNISGKAVEMIQNRLDMQSFIYVSNFAKTIKHAAKVWLSMASDIYVEDDRKMKSIGTQEEINYVKLNEQVFDEEGTIKRKNDLSEAKMDISVDVGPSSSSRKASVVRALTGMMQITTDPSDVKVLGAAALMNMEGEGLGDIRKYYRKQLLRMGVVTPTKQEEQDLIAEMQNQQPDPQAQYLQAAAQEAQAKSMKAQADTALAMAKAEETKAETEETLTNLTRQGREHIINTAKQINEMTMGNEGQ